MDVWVRSRSVQGIGIGAGILIAGVVAVNAFNTMQTVLSPNILAPASVPPVVGLCTQPLTTSVDGPVTPLFCPNGEINTVAWKNLAAGGSNVMALNRDSGPGEVRAAIEKDIQYRQSGIGECSAALLAAAYYGWGFHIDPVDGLPLDCSILK